MNLGRDSLRVADIGPANCAIEGISSSLNGVKWENYVQPVLASHRGLETEPI